MRADASMAAAIASAAVAHVSRLLLVIAYQRDEESGQKLRDDAVPVAGSEVTLFAWVDGLIDCVNSS
jgi:hypothetical protein